MAKRYRLLGAAFTLAIVPAMAQIPNAGFEQWEDQGGYTEPTGWITYNDLMTPQGYFTTVEPGTPGAEGVSYALIESRTVPGGSTIQGWMSAAPAGHGAPSGFAYTGRPSELTGQWQYGIQPNDTAVVSVGLVQTDSATGNVVAVIAEGTLEVTGSQGAWTVFTVPLTYYSDAIPDKAGIQFEASKSFASPTAGSFLKVDDLGFSGWVGVQERSVVHPLLLYPTLALDIINVESDTRMERFDIIDMSGRILKEQLLNTYRASLDVANLTSGQYLVRVGWKDGTRSTARFTKE